MFISRLPKEYPQNPQTVGEHLLKVRLDRKLTKKAVANEIGVTSSTVAIWEQGKCQPEVVQMKGIITFLGYYPFPAPETLPEQIRKYRRTHGLTLEDFGKLLTVDGATVWTWENEKYIPSELAKKKINDFIVNKELSL